MFFGEITGEIWTGALLDNSVMLKSTFLGVKIV